MRQEFGRPLRTLDVPGYRLRETLYSPTQEIAAHLHPWATLCLTVAGGYVEDWGVTRVRCDRASFVFHPPGDVYGDRISDAGSRCLTIAVDPAVFSSAADAIPSLARLRASRRAPPNWLAFQLQQELELGDDLSPASVEGTVLALLAEVGERPALEARGTPPPWLERVKEQIHDEFASGPSLESRAHRGRPPGASRPRVPTPLRVHTGALYPPAAHRVRLPPARGISRAVVHDRARRRVRRSESLD